LQSAIPHRREAPGSGTRSSPCWRPRCLHHASFIA
jgi:hypothetical protein